MPRLDGNGPQNLDGVIANYVAVWNESDPVKRRERIRSVWAADDVTCFRLLDAHGYDAIEGRVAGSWDKWLRDGKHIFKPTSNAYHHDIVRLDFLMVTVPDGKVEARGLSFLILDCNGRIQFDYQFNPTVDEAGQFVDRYLSALNEERDDRRRELIAELWAPDAICVNDKFVRYGHSEIVQHTAEAHRMADRDRCVFKSARASHSHHNMVTFKWQLEREPDGNVLAAGSDLIILNDNGRISRDYRFEERR